MCVSPLALRSRRGRGVWVTALQSLVKAKDRDWRVTLEIILESLIFFFARAGGGGRLRLPGWVVPALPPQDGMCWCPSPPQPERPLPTARSAEQRAGEEGGRLGFRFELISRFAPMDLTDNHVRVVKRAGSLSSILLTSCYPSELPGCRNGEGT